VAFQLVPLAGLRLRAGQVVLLLDGLIVIDSVLKAGGLSLLSVTFTVNEYVPGVVGVPEIVPSLSERDKPGGKPQGSTHVHV